MTAVASYTPEVEIRHNQIHDQLLAALPALAVQP